MHCRNFLRRLFPPFFSQGEAEGKGDSNINRKLNLALVHNCLLSFLPESELVVSFISRCRSNSEFSDATVHLSNFNRDSIEMITS